MQYGLNSGSFVNKNVADKKLSSRILANFFSTICARLREQLRKLFSRWRPTYKRWLSLGVNLHTLEEFLLAVVLFNGFPWLADVN